MQAYGVPRLDAGAEGIHLVWTWPDVLPLSIDGYDIQRIDARELRWEAQCEDIDRWLIGYLRVRREYPAPLGPLRLQSGITWKSIDDAELLSPSGDPGDHPQGFGPPNKQAVHASLSSVLATSIAPATSVGPEFDLFIQELTTPVERASVEVSGQLAIAMAMSGDKVVQVVPAGPLPATMQLQAPSIDTILVYVVSPLSLHICAYQRPAAKPNVPDPIWSSAPYIVKGLTLPIHEADAALTTPALEYAAATGRMMASETLTNADFTRLTTGLRDATAGVTLGRSGERIVLVRADTSQSFEELTFDSQLGALALHPKVRRVLGFGYRDHQGLVPGASYEYRITGRFRAEDLTDTIYDVHRVPASTPLPAAFFIRDLNLRFQTPVQVVFDPPPATTALHAASRRGIRIDTSGYDSSWFLPFLGWSAIIGLPRPVTRIVLEVAPGHSFTYAAGLPWSFGSQPPTPLPAGPVVVLTFPSPVMELRLAGTGTLYAVRVPSGQTGIVELHAYTGPIQYAAQPLPLAPPVFTAYNLQQPPTILTGPINESTPVPPRPPVGFKLNWLPPATGGLSVWPEDLGSAPPLDTLAYKIQHRPATPPSTFGPWQPIAGDDNITVGSRDDSAPTVRLEMGCDLDALFPAKRPRGPGAGFALHLSDVFGEKDPATGEVLRPEPPLGSYHQYRIQSMDAVGRVSAGTKLSNIARLEKHVPPPLPVGHQPEAPLDINGHLTAPPGPRARAIIAGAPGLTPEDITLLGPHQNAVLLEWGWRQTERDLDPTTAEFRVYSSVPLDVVEGVVNAVASAANYCRLWITTNIALVKDELVGQWITSNGYPFQVVHNDAGTTPSLLVAFAKLNPAIQPVVGPVTFGRPLQPSHQRPHGWDQRVAVYPLTAGDNYQHVFYDVLNLSVAHPRDALWVGVSAADAQSYVPDELTVGNLSNRPGNESGIAACGIVARYRGRPTFSMPPPLGDVPEIVTDEPTGRQVLVSLDLNALLGGALPSGAPCVLERCPSDDIISRTSLANGNVVLTHPDNTQEIISFPNPGDHTEVTATLNSDNPQRLATKYLFHLVAASSDPSVFFQRIGDDVAVVGPVDDRLAPKPGRFLYLVRAADALGHISAGSGLLPAVVRVPSTAPGSTPQRRALATTDTAATLTVAVAGNDPDTTTLLLFAAKAPPGSNPPVQGEAELLRSPNRRDLYPNDGLRLLLSDGTLLTPALVKKLTDLDVGTEADGTRVAALTIAAAKGSWVTLWCYGLTRDGLPSYPCGPFGTGVRS